MSGVSPAESTNLTRMHSQDSQIKNSHLFQAATKGQWKSAAMIVAGVALGVIAVVGLLHGVSIFGIGAHTAASVGAGTFLSAGLISGLGKAYKNHQDLLRKEQQERDSEIGHSNDAYTQSLGNETANAQQ